MPVLSNKGAKQPRENADIITAGTDEKLKVQIGLNSIGDKDVKVMSTPPSICTVEG